MLRKLGSRINCYLISLSIYYDNREFYKPTAKYCITFPISVYGSYILPSNAMILFRVYLTSDTFTVQVHIVRLIDPLVSSSFHIICNNLCSSNVWFCRIIVIIVHSIQKVPLYINIHITAYDNQLYVRTM